MKWEEMQPIQPVEVPLNVQRQAIAAFERAGVAVGAADMEWRYATWHPEESSDYPKRAYAATHSDLFCGFWD